MLLKTEARTV